MIIHQRPVPNCTIECTEDEIESYKFRGEGLWIFDSTSTTPCFWWLLNGNWSLVIIQENKKCQNKAKQT